jgi:uncharacterized membrane protein YgaE (UPF0421/DUF939 family)
MKQIMTTLMLIGVAIAFIVVVAFPSIWSDMGTTKQRSEQQYSNAFHN